jgi:4,5-dihydroxyphthalate decarboxylase
LDIRSIPAGTTLARMLAEGEIDALYTPRVPSPFRDGDKRVKRLFEDVVSAEKEYFAATGIFPIMHVVVIRADVYERHRWVAQSLYKACLRARDLAYERIYDSSALRFMEPWLIQHLEDSRELLGRDYWSYGLADNEKVLDVFLGYHHAQGLSRKRYAPADLFAPETMEAFVI